MSNEENDYYQTILQKRINELIGRDETTAEISRIKRDISQLERHISVQVKNLRDASDTSKKHIQADIEDMSQELEQKQGMLSKLEDAATDNRVQAKQYEEAKQILLSFKEHTTSSTTMFRG